jgi:hypothetical protein
MVYLEYLWAHREGIAAWIASTLAALTVIVHGLERVAAAFARLAERTASKTDDAAAQKLSKVLAWWDTSLSGVARWLPHVGVTARKSWSAEERNKRMNGTPSLVPPSETPSDPPSA